jgi:hypothetical protein
MVREFHGGNKDAYDCIGGHKHGSGGIACIANFSILPRAMSLIFPG